MSPEKAMFMAKIQLLMNHFDERIAQCHGEELQAAMDNDRAAAIWGACATTFEAAKKAVQAFLLDPLEIWPTEPSDREDL